MTDFPNSVSAKAVAAGHSKLGGSGATAVAIANAIAARGIPIVQTPAADLIDATGYTGTLLAGTYNRAAILALLAGTTKLLSVSFTVAVGTANFTQGGAITALPLGSEISKPYVLGSSIDDFSLVVAGGGSVYIEARGV